MGSTTVVTDSTASLPADLLEASGIRTVSLAVIHADGRSQLEEEIGDLAAYWDEIADLEHLPTTSQPSVGRFTEVYEPLLEQGQDIVSVHLSSGISGTYDAAMLAAADMRERFPDRTIEIVDSTSAAGGLALIALAAARLAAGGADGAAVAERTRAGADSARIWFAVETLEYLRRGGRIGGAAAWLGGALKIKPILTVDGEITPVERVRTSRRAFERLVSYATDQHAAGHDTWAVQHVQAASEAERLIDACRPVFGTEPVFVSEIGPVIGTHVGPGLLGLGTIPSELLPSR